MTGNAPARWCVQCGGPVGDARFCVHCGHPIAPVSAGPAPLPDRTPTRASAPTPVVAPPPGGGRPRRSGPPPVLVALVVVLLIAGVGAAYLIGTRSSDDRESATGKHERDRGTTAEASADGEPSAAPPSTSVEGEPVEETPVDDVPTLREVTLDDDLGDQQLRNSGPRVSRDGDIARVRVVPSSDGEAGWILVQFADGGVPSGAVILNLDTDGDRRPDFVAWQDQATGGGGSFPTDDWLHGHDIVERDWSQDPRFDVASDPPPGTGIAFPMRFASDELAEGRLRVNVQVINADDFYDYSPGRHGWSRLVAFQATP